MVSFGLGLTISVFVLCISIYHVASLQCYECTSLLDDKCGKTWGYDGDDEGAKKYLKTCVGTTVACQKIENEGEMEGQAVTRSCWTSDSVEYYTPETKCKSMHNGEVCYCRDEGKPCNGKQPLHPQFATILLGLSFLMFKFFL